MLKKYGRSYTQRCTNILFSSMVFYLLGFHLNCTIRTVSLQFDYTQRLFISFSLEQSLIFRFCFSFHSIVSLVSNWLLACDMYAYFINVCVCMGMRVIVKMVGSLIQSLLQFPIEGKPKDTLTNERTYVRTNEWKNQN